jgi:hypothetical protein
MMLALIVVVLGAAAKDVVEAINANTAAIQEQTKVRK